jgi:hypothetical protein
MLIDHSGGQLARRVVDRLALVGRHRLQRAIELAAIGRHRLVELDILAHRIGQQLAIRLQRLTPPPRLVAIKIRQRHHHRQRVVGRIHHPRRTHRLVGR